MSAAEKLRALIEAGPRVMREGGVEGRWVSMDALPQIVAAVEAMEVLNRVMPRSRTLRLEYTKAIREVRAALSAPDEVLGDVT